MLESDISNKINAYLNTTFPPPAFSKTDLPYQSVSQEVRVWEGRRGQDFGILQMFVSPRKKYGELITG